MVSDNYVWMFKTFLWNILQKKSFNSIAKLIVNGDTEIMTIFSWLRLRGIPYQKYIVSY